MTRRPTDDHPTDDHRTLCPVCLGTGKLRGSEWHGAPWPACPRCEGGRSVPAEQRVGDNDDDQSPAP